VDLAGRDVRCAQGGAGGGKLEALAVHIVAVGDLVSHRQRMPIHHAGREFEGQFGVEEFIVGISRTRQAQCQHEHQQAGHEQQQAPGRRRKSGKTGHENFLSTGLDTRATE
jgi:hypothetical protein